MKEIFGGFIEFESQPKLVEFVETMDKAMAIKIVEASMDYAVHQGLYSLDEVYCLWGCLLKLKEEEKKPE